MFIVYPLAVAGLLMTGLGGRYFIVFIVSAVVGTTLEWLLGHYYHHIVGKRLWIYQRASIGGYTSWLIVPLWGVAGILFAFLNSWLPSKL